METKSRKLSTKTIVIAVVLAIIGALVVWGQMTDIDKVSITEEYAQGKISERLPIQKDLKVPLLKMGITVDRVDVDFQDGDILGVVAHATVNTRFGDADVEVRTTGTPVYKDMAFHYHPTSFEFSEFKLSGKAKASMGTAGQIASNASKRLDGYLKKKGLLEGTDISVAMSADEITDKIRKAAKPGLEKVITKYLNRYPIKKLDGIKGTIVSLAIDKIQIEDGTLTIDFSLLKLTVRVLIFALLFLVAIIGLWFFFPLWVEIS
jgi:hypothetical protein